MMSIPFLKHGSSRNLFFLKINDDAFLFRNQFPVFFPSCETISRFGLGGQHNRIIRKIRSVPDGLIEKRNLCRIHSHTAGAGIIDFYLYLRKTSRQLKILLQILSNVRFPVLQKNLYIRCGIQKLFFLFAAKEPLIIGFHRLRHQTDGISDIRFDAFRRKTGIGQIHQRKRELFSELPAPA